MTRPVPISKQIEDLRSELALLKMAQDRLSNVACLGMVLRSSGLEVLGYDGPARYELGRAVQCELCGKLLDVSDRGYELKLLSKTWGWRYGYLHQECFQKATRLD